MLAAFASSYSASRDTLTFRVEAPTNSVRKAAALDARIMKRRLAIAKIEAAVTVVNRVAVRIVLYHRDRRTATQILEARGHIVLKARPSGDIYYPGAASPIAGARMGNDLLGNPCVYFSASNPQGFLKFTKHHLHEDLQIYLDGLLIASPEITQAFSGEGEIAGNLSASRARYLASVLGGGVLAYAVRLSRSSANHRQ